MAKKAAVAAVDNGGDAADQKVWTMQTLPAAGRRIVQSIKRTVTDFAREFGHMRVKASEAARPVMDAYRALAQELGGLSFVAFCRLYDPSIPEHAGKRANEPGYRDHPFYQSMDYLRREDAKRLKTPRASGGTDPATDILARELAAILQAIDPADHRRVFEHVYTEFGIVTPRTRTAIVNRVANTKPLVDLAALGIKPVRLKPEALQHLEPAVGSKAEARQEVAAEGPQVGGIKRRLQASYDAMQGGRKRAANVATMRTAGARVTAAQRRTA